MAEKLTLEKFVRKANIIHDNFYDYYKTEYKNTKTKIVITCPKHGDFLIHPYNHINGKGCQKCSKNNSISKNSLNNDKFIEKAKSVHGGLYDYSKVNYTGTHNKVIIICKVHGEFEQTPGRHSRGDGCKKCNINKNHKNTLYGLKEFVEKAKSVHGDLYDYSKVNYKGTNDKVIIICKIHGEFEQTPGRHSRGDGCKKCGNKNISTRFLKNTDDFIEKSKSTHGDLYDYSKVNYTGIHNKVKIICKIHEEFEQTPNVHYRHGCPKCSEHLSTSKGEKEVFSFISSIIPDVEVQENVRSIISPYELDIFIPSHSLAIEFNGLYWHSEINKSRNYHYDKYLKCNSQGIRLVQIWEHEWLNKRELCESFLSSLLILQTKLYARKLTLKEVSITEQREFLDKFHFQGYSSSSICIGLYHNDVLIQLMSLRKLNQSGDYEIGRLCTRSGYVVVGGSERLFSSLKSLVNFSSIISYNNLDKFSGEVYERLGMKLMIDRTEGYFYTDGISIFPRQHFQKHKLVAQGHDPSLTELEITSSLGLFRLFPTGSSKYSLSF